MEETKANAPIKKVNKQKLLRCVDWLQKQNEEESKKLSLQNKNVNDIQFILETNAERRKFHAAEDDATVPDAVDESQVTPKAVPLHKLRVEQLHLECEWQPCNWVTGNYDEFQKHVRQHITDLHVLDSEEKTQYVCRWDVCGHKTVDFNEMIRHINFHAFHGKLLAIGFNGRATLKLEPCKKDSSKRNHIPPLLHDHCCMWTGCDMKFNAIQAFFDHAQYHINISDKLVCSWAGCGATFRRKVLFVMHLRSHTKEKLIACYHCGQRFTCNRKLCDHLRRQNVDESSSYACTMCRVTCATEYLLREHARSHVSLYACSLCDMSAPTRDSLAMHVRYRHLGRESGVRNHPCPHCEYRAVTKWDLKRHVDRHLSKDKHVKRKLKQVAIDDDDVTDEENEKIVKKRKKNPYKYICHMCPENKPKLFTLGAKLTLHLVKVHGVQWPNGHCRFRYQISEDGLFRLTTTRYESLEISEKILDGSSGPKAPINTNSFDFEVVQQSEATEDTPNKFVIKLKGDDAEKDKPAVEITMCDVDEHGNIIKSDVYYT